MRKRFSITVLRIGIVLSGAIAIALTAFVFIPAFMREDDLEFMVILFILSTSVAPFLVALYQAMKLINYLDKNKTFSDRTLRALGYIKYCAVTIGILYILTMPFIVWIAEEDDAPGAVLYGLILVFAPFFAASFIDLLQREVKTALSR